MSTRLLVSLGLLALAPACGTRRTYPYGLDSVAVRMARGELPSLVACEALDPMKTVEDARDAHRIANYLPYFLLDSVVVCVRSDTVRALLFRDTVFEMGFVGRRVQSEASIEEVWRRTSEALSARWGKPTAVSLAPGRGAVEELGVVELGLIVADWPYRDSIGAVVNVRSRQRRGERPETYLTVLVQDVAFAARRGLRPQDWAK